MATIRVSDETLQRIKSLSDGQSADKFLNKLMNQICTNNNASTETPTEPEPNKPVILPSGTVLVDSDRYVLDGFGNRCKYPGGHKDAVKVIKYLKLMTSHPFNSHDEQEYRAAHFIRRWYTADDYQSNLDKQELEETSQYLTSHGYALRTETVSLTPNSTTS